MAVIAAGLRLVVVLFSLQMHQVKLIDQALLFQQRNGSVHRRPVDLRVLLLSQLQEFGRIEMARRVLNDPHQHAPLRCDANSSGDEFIHQGTACN